MEKVCDYERQNNTLVVGLNCRNIIAAVISTWSTEARLDARAFVNVALRISAETSRFQLQHVDSGENHYCGVSGSEMFREYERMSKLLLGGDEEVRLSAEALDFAVCEILGFRNREGLRRIRRTSTFQA